MTTRERLTKKLNLHLPEYLWKSEDLEPAKGAWRSNKALDVYCWETFVSDIDGIRYYIGSWQTMTELCKCNKFKINDLRELEGWIE